MNSSRKALIAGNWKMNQGGASACDLATEVAKLTHPFTDIDVVIAPPFTALAAVAHDVDGTLVAVAGQNMHAQESGAFTGEISGAMLLECGATWVILGHSERRQLLGETDALIAEKTRSALRQKIRPIVCVGETLEERESGQTLAVVGRQVQAFASLLGEAPGFAAIAYEPVWAIGTGKTAGPEQAQEVHAAIRQQLRALSPALADPTRILYGGSVNAKNADALLACPDVDGALVGGASLKAEDFAVIARAAHQLGGKKN